jgi:hypothetical protein
MRLDPLYFKEIAMRMAIVVLLGLMSATPREARAQYDLIAVFSDNTHADCAVSFTCINGDCGYLGFYVFQYSASGTQGSRFKAPYQYCFYEHSFFWESHPFAGTTGNSQVGVTIPYGSCLSGWIHVLTVWYYSGSHIGAGQCCQYPVLPHPESSTGEVEVLNCAGSWVSSDNAPAIVNADPSCPCSTPSGIADQITTWGAVKALYVED